MEKKASNELRELLDTIEADIDDFRRGVSVTVESAIKTGIRLGKIDALQKEDEHILAEGYTKKTVERITKKAHEKQMKAIGRAENIMERLELRLKRQYEGREE